MHYSRNVKSAVSKTRPCQHVPTYNATTHTYDDACDVPRQVTIGRAAKYTYGRILSLLNSSTNISRGRKTFFILLRRFFLSYTFLPLLLLLLAAPFLRISIHPPGRLRTLCVRSVCWRSRCFWALIPLLIPGYCTAESKEIVERRGKGSRAKATVAENAAFQDVILVFFLGWRQCSAAIDNAEIEQN